MLISVRNGVPIGGDRTSALRVVINKRAAMLRPKIKATGTPERVLEKRLGSNKRSTREARGEIIPAMPVEIPQNSDEEELDEEAEFPRFRRAIPINRRRRCRVCRENPARGASVPCLALATATLCVACFIDRHPQYVDSIVRMIVVDTLPNLEKMMSDGESASEGESGISVASGKGSPEEERAEIGLPALCAVVPRQDDLQESDHPELELYAMVARPVTKAERLVNPKAMASLDKAWNKLENQIVWEVEKVMPWRVIAEEARASGEVVHVGRIFDICVEKLFWLTDLHVVNGVSGASCRHGLVDWGGTCYKHVLICTWFFSNWPCVSAGWSSFPVVSLPAPPPLEEEIMSSFGTDFCGLIADGVGPTCSSAHPPARSFELRDKCVVEHCLGILDGSMSSFHCCPVPWDVFVAVHFCMHAPVFQDHTSLFEDSFCGNGSIACCNYSGLYSPAKRGNGYFGSPLATNMSHWCKRSSISLLRDDDGGHADD